MFKTKKTAIFRALFSNFQTLSVAQPRSPTPILGLTILFRIERQG